MSLRLLYELQQLDSVRAEGQAALDEVQAALSDNRRIVSVQHQVERVRAQYTKQSTLRRDAELALQRIETREQEIEARLYGGAVTNPRDLGALQEEQAMLQRRRSDAEDTLLELMVIAEELQDLLTSGERTLAALEEQRRQRIPRLQDQERMLNGELAALNRDREALLPQIESHLLALYESLLSTRGGQAVSRVDAIRSMCETCRVTFPRSDLRRIRSEGAIVQCNNCRRILYLE